ncbi:MAG: methyltransferase domain-containing protein [Candidatus Methanoperedens sp.]|nr:methyltransferase domain-containing protein [Candidatus Methanoperedens sp.]MCZ7369868.1 methyltransferase domain-containing protein [Candidatus Methanoperedens sp.]
MGVKENAIKQFGKRAEAYSKGNIFVDGVHLSEVVKRSGVKKNHIVLDIATGSGFLAFEYAKIANTAIGCDLTRNMLLFALEKQEIYGLENTGFLLSDVESLPFPDRSFDIVSCRFAFHHFPDPKKALSEMKRVTKGRIVLVDGVSSENPGKSQFHNRIEKMRDPSHVRIYPLSEMKNMFNDIGADIIDLTHWDIPQDFDEWIRRAGTDETKTNLIEDLMRQSAIDDATGLGVNLKDGKLGFAYDTVILVAEVVKYG